MNQTESQLRAELDALKQQMAALTAEQQRIVAERDHLLVAEKSQRALAEALTQTAAVLCSTLRGEEVLDRILEQLQRVAPHDAACVLLLEGEMARVFRWHGYNGPGRRPRFAIAGATFPVERMPSMYRVKDTGEPVVQNIAVSNDPWVRKFGRNWVQAYACVPIRDQGQVIGFLIADSESPHYFEQFHIDALRVFADQVNIALNNTRLHDQERHARGQQVKQVKRKHNFMTTVLDTTEALVVALDPQGRTILINQACENIVGLTAEQVRGQYFWEWASLSEQVEQVTTIFEQLAITQSTVQFETHIATPTRQPRLIAWSSSVALDRSEQPEYIIATGIDITEKRQAEIDIKARNRDLHLLNQVIAASTAGWTLEEVLERVCRELSLAFEVPLVAATRTNAEQTATVFVAEYRADASRPSTLNEAIPMAQNQLTQQIYTRKTPRTICITDQDESSVLLRDWLAQRGAWTLLIVPIVIDDDVTGCLVLETVIDRQFTTAEINLAQRAADQMAGVLTRAQLSKTYLRLNAAVENMAEAVIISNANRRIRYVNPAFIRLSGLSAAEILGTELETLFQTNRQRPDHIYHQVSQGQPWQGRLTKQRKDGTTYVTDTTVTLVRDENQLPLAYIGVQRDITHELELAAQLRQSQKMETVGQLAGGIAHDFNNILTAIMGYAGLGLNVLSVDHQVYQDLKSILKNAQRAAALIRQLMTFSRHYQSHPRVLNLNEVIVNMDLMLSRLIDEDIKLATIPCEGVIRVKVDPHQLEQVIANLVVNARDALPAGGSITLRTALISIAHPLDEIAPGDYVVLTVADTGVGIPPDVQSRIFEPFFTTKPIGQGTGLGLAVCHNIIQNHGGYITVDSVVNEGTTFKIYLPAVTGGDTINPWETGPLIEPTYGTETILLVEDDESIRDLTARVLRERGYSVLEAPHGAVALQILRVERPRVDLLLSDVVMPHLGGVDLAKSVKAMQPNIKVLLMSGYAHQDITKDLANFTMLLLPKPFKPETLLHMVRQILDT